MAQMLIKSPRFPEVMTGGYRAHLSFFGRDTAVTYLFSRPDTAATNIFSTTIPKERMNNHHPSRHSECAICRLPTRPFSRYCTAHAARGYRTGDPRGVILKDHELRPLREKANEYLDRQAHHPAVIAAHDYMDGMLHSRLPARFLGTHFDRLRDYGATPRELLVAFLAVMMYDYSDGPRLSDNCVTVNMGRAVLKVRPLPGRFDRKGKRRTLAPTGQRCRQLGQLLRGALGLFGGQFIRYMRESEEKPRRAQEAMRAACEVPFSNTSVPPAAPAQAQPPIASPIDELSEHLSD